jgi:hypothetical protein
MWGLVESLLRLIWVGDQEKFCFLSSFLNAPWATSMRALFAALGAASLGTVARFTHLG